MQSRGDESVMVKMAEMRLICDREIPIQQQRIDSALLSFHNSLLSSKSKAQETLQLQEKLGKLKAELREAEDGLMKILAVKTRKEAKRMAMMDSISAAKARLEELKGVVEDQRARKDEYAAIISRQSDALAALEEMHNRNSERRDEIEEAISWYNRVLGFQIECGHGVKFIFTNIDLKNPNQKYSFTVRHENDVYSLLDCDPPLNDTNELINELNRNNGLFKFVRTMREKFQEAATCGNFPQVSSHEQDTSTISLSAPVSSVSTDSRSESPPKTKELQPVDLNRYSMKVNPTIVGRKEILSPGSTSSLRRSPRFRSPGSTSSTRRSPRLKVKK
ncbi:hypothetical protein ACH5RR_025502 [Cinchona calisaya]|uniref:Kinetochore protein SPC25 n=1 Tax=Cinchona calisaya TaxID=153742 RepID=A0ABD2Z372_9GENT